MHRIFVLTMIVALLGLNGCKPVSNTDGSETDSNTTAAGETNVKTTGAGEQPHVAFVTNGIDPFWEIAAKGAMHGGEEFDAKVDVRMPPKGPEDQKRMVQGLLTGGVDGIAISPIDSENQADFLDEIAERTNMITQDADAPDSKRLMYIGMDNYIAGRMCGELIKEALPDGGNVIIFVGRLGQSNADARRQGVIDELMDRSHDSSRYDPPSAGEIKNDKFTIHDTRTDGFDFPKCKAQAEDAIARYADLDCMVGLFSYNPPLILEAVRAAGELDKIKVVAFDEHEITLQAIGEGEMHGTIVQNPYRYGYESVRVLAALARGDKSVIPEDGFLDIPARKILKSNVAEFSAELEEMLKGKEPTAP